LSTTVIVIDPTRCSRSLLAEGAGVGTATELGGFADPEAETVAEGDPITLVARDEQATPSITIAIESDVVVPRVIDLLLQRG
jgi:hypothetical protein